MNTNKLLEISPYLEVFVRYIYWNSTLLISRRNKLIHKKKTIIPKSNTGRSRISLSLLMDKLRQLETSDGDLIIVHSSMRELNPLGENASTIIDSLIHLVGKNGTIAMPAIPIFKNEPIGIDRIKANISQMVFEYDINNTKAWTGVLPNALMGYEEAVRSRHPLNSMVAIGPLSKPMMAMNLMGCKPLPCGENSSWKFCADNHAKIIGLGTDLAHSLTMIHVAEDVMDDKWPVKNWYRDRKCIIIDGITKTEVVVRERHPKWAIHYAERTLSKDLLKENILTRDYVAGILIEMIDAQRLIDYLNSRNHNAYPYYGISSGKFKKQV